MGRINLHNYEAYLLDLSEGNLDDQLQMELEVFLIQHPELNQLMSEFLFLSEDESIKFNEKGSLKRSERDLVTESMFIEYLELQMPLKKRWQLEKSCANNVVLQQELKLYESTIVKPDLSVVFPDKEVLKRKPKLIWFDFSARHFAAAACVLFLLGAWVFWTNLNPKISAQQFAEISNGTKNLKSISPVLPTQDSTVSFPSQPTTRPHSTPHQLVSLMKENIIVEDSLLNNMDNHFTVNDSLLCEPIVDEQLAFKDNLPPTVIEVLTESDGEDNQALPVKKGLWATASRALKNLNQAGIKSVDGEEQASKNKSGYVLTFGGISIVHKPANL